MPELIKYKVEREIKERFHEKVNKTKVEVTLIVSETLMFN